MNGPRKLWRWRRKGGDLLGDTEQILLEPFKDDIAESSMLDLRQSKHAAIMEPSRHCMSGRMLLRSITISRTCRRLKPLLHYLLLSLGALYIALALRSFVSAILPDNVDWIARRLEQYAPDASPFGNVNVFPIACHSHNDYWRPRPLFTALENGCIAVEADVWLTDNNDEVLVGHIPTALSPDRTLSALYLDPILEILDRANSLAKEVDRYKPEQEHDTTPLYGVFDTAPQTSLVLLIDFKSNSDELWHRVSSQLDPLRHKGFLTHFNGTAVVDRPVIVVVSGEVAFANVVENTHYRDMFFDAPLEEMSPSTPPLPAENGVRSRGERPPAMIEVKSASTSILGGLVSYDSTNSFYASVSFKSSIGFPIHSTLSQQQMALMRSQIRGAHARGLRVRYWGIPSWPIGIRNYLWRVMVREGVDFLSVDDVRAVAKDDWGPRKGGWGRKWWY